MQKILKLHQAGQPIAIELMGTGQKVLVFPYCFFRVGSQALLVSQRNARRVPTSRFYVDIAGFEVACC